MANIGFLGLCQHREKSEPPSFYLRWRLTTRGADSFHFKPTHSSVMISSEPLIIRNFHTEVRKADHHPMGFLGSICVTKEKLYNNITIRYSIRAQVILILDTADPKSPRASSGSQ